MGDMLLKLLFGAVVGAIGAAVAVGVYEAISKSNLAEVIREAFLRRKREQNVQLEVDALFSSIVREKEKDSISVEVFFGREDTVESEVLTIQAKTVSGDIHEGDIVSFAGDSDVMMGDIPEIDLDGLPDVNLGDIPEIDMDELVDS